MGKAANGSPDLLFLVFWGRKWAGSVSLDQLAMN